MKTVETLILENYKWLTRMAFRYCRDKEDAADLVNETIYKCLRSASIYDVQKDFRSWSLRIMENTYITQYNRRLKVPFVGYDDCISFPSSGSTDALAATNLIMKIVDDCSSRSCCIECVMLYAQGYSYDEIAALVGIFPGTVKSRIRDGRRLLRKALGL